MAYFRQIHVSTWKDPWFFDLEPDEKLLFIYLFSNENTSISGLYQIPFRVICFETGLDSDYVELALDKFSKVEKVYFENGVVWVKNLRKYHATSSKKLLKGIENDLRKVPECPIKEQYIAYYSPKIPYTDGIDTLSSDDKYPMDTDLHSDSDSNTKSDPDAEAEEGAASPASNSFYSQIAPDKILCDASGLSYFPADQSEWVEVVIRLAEDHGIKKTTDAMKRACDQWVGTKSKNGRPYRQTNLNWINWAQEILAGGELPSQGKKKLTTEEEIEKFKREKME